MHWSDPEWQPSPELAALSDDQLLAAARAQIKSLARDIAEIANAKAAAVEHGLYAHRWPPRSLRADELCDVLDEGRLVLAHVRDAGLSIHAALASVAVARGLRDNERRRQRTKEPQT